jgi:outer membrane receptor for ferrienterochelin and colicin
MPNANVYARFSLALHIAVPLILLGGRISAAPQSAPQGADSEQAIDEVAVVAHKVERSTRDIAANVTVVSREDLSANLAATVADVFCSKTVIEGIEAGGHINLQSTIGEFRLDGSLYLARGENRENGQALNSVGPGQAVAGASWYAPSANRSVRLQATFTEAWDDRDESSGGLFKPAGHAVFDLYYTHQFGDRTTICAGLLNLTDRVYWNWSDVGGLSPTDPVLPYLAQPGTSLSVSVNLNWQ